MFFDRFLKASRRNVPLPVRKKSSTTVKPQPVKENLEANLKDILESVGDPGDLYLHRFEDENKTAAVVIFLETLADSNLLAQYVIEPLNRFVQGQTETLSANKLKIIISAARVMEIKDFHQAVESFLSGDTLILLPGVKSIFAVSLPGVPTRAIEEAPTEKGIKGPREGFNETINDNIGLIRRYIRDPNLRLDKKLVGERTKTEVAVLYLNDVANPAIVKEVHKRLEQIKIDGILESGYIAQLITDRRTTIFPLAQETERPDKVAGAILEGRVAIMVDRSPFNIIVPVTSNEFYQTQEDFYFNPYIATLLKLIRGLGTIIAVTLPGFYLAMVSVNPELLPPTVVQLEASSRVQVPLPAVLEMSIAFFAFEVLRESSVRFPAGINMIFGIGGGIVMGLAAINAGLVSGITVAVVVFTVLGTFCTANLAKEQVWRFIRYFLFFAGAAFGFMGVIAAGVVVLAHMSSLKSFGVSYMAPWAPPLAVDIADAPARLPFWVSHRRPPTYRPQEEDRLGETEGEDEA